MRKKDKCAVLYRNEEDERVGLRSTRRNVEDGEMDDAMDDKNGDDDRTNLISLFIDIESF